MSTFKPRVLISGAGIAGPCLAYWLARSRRDIAITIVERSPVPRTTGQSIDIHGGAIEIVKKMQLEETIRALHTTEKGTRFINPSGKAFAQFNAGETFTAEYEILRGDMAKVFLDATNKLQNVEYIYGDSIKSLEQTDAGVDVTFAKAPKQRYNLVVGADGASSQVRSMILDEQSREGSYNFLGQYLAFFSIKREEHDSKFWQWFNTPKGLSMMLRPHRNNTTMGAYMCITMPARGVQDHVVEEALETSTEATKQMLHQYFDGAGWEAKRILEGMDKAEDFYMSRAAQVKLPKWTSGRGAVLGDAAFATFGVGTTLAIESAYFLAGELSKIQSNEDIPSALQQYEEAFRPLYAKMEDIPSFFPQAVFPQTAWALRLRNAALWTVSKTKLYKVFQGGSSAECKLPTYDWISV